MYEPYMYTFCARVYEPYMCLCMYEPYMYTFYARMHVQVFIFVTFFFFLASYLAPPLSFVALGICCCSLTVCDDFSASCRRRLHRGDRPPRRRSRPHF